MVPTRAGESPRQAELPVWISLGGGCRVAYQLRRCHLRVGSMPFDWIRTPFRSVIALIAGDFADFLRAGDLRLHAGPPRVLRDGRYGIVLPHDADVFEAGGAAALQDRFRPRVEAFRHALRTRRRVVFVRRQLEADEADALLAVLRRRHPHLRVTVVGVHDGEESPRSVERVGDFLRISAPSTSRRWSGCDATWDRVLGEAMRQVLATLPRASLPARVLGEDWYRIEMALAQLLTERAGLLRRVPPVLIEALIAAEDHRFRHHRGVDVRAVARALLGMLTGRSLGGGSTIEQQLYRTLTGRRERTLVRKLRELLGARMLGGLLDKDALASLYLVVAYFGARMNGVEQACARMQIDLAAMDALQAAGLVARLKYPEPRVAGAARLQQIERRVAWIVRRMQESGRRHDPHADRTLSPRPQGALP